MEKENLNFTAIDFETMTPARSSACAIGIVRVDKGIIMEKFYSLIKPVPDDYTHTNTFVNGISEEMVENAPTFAELWGIISRFFTHQTVIAHNASFDIDVLEKTALAYSIPFPEIEMIGDTLEITHCGLDKSCEMAHIPLPEHHDALCDATACAEIFLIANRITIKHLNKKSGPTIYGDGAKDIDSETKRPLEADEVENKDTPFFQKKVVLTGNLESYPSREVISEMLKNVGADINGNISSKTNIVIVGQGAGPSKMKKISMLKEDGVDIRIIEEPELLEILDKYNIK
jgi:DNA polymerase III subunit epsilon